MSESLLGKGPGTYCGVDHRRSIACRMAMDPTQQTTESPQMVFIGLCSIEYSSLRLRTYRRLFSSPCASAVKPRVQTGFSFSLDCSSTVEEADVVSAWA